MKKYLAIGSILCLVFVSTYYFSVIQNNFPQENIVKKTESSTTTIAIQKQMLVTEVISLNDQLEKMNLSYQKSSTPKDKAFNIRLLTQIVKQRKESMKQLMKDNPALFNAIAIKSTERSSFPDSVQNDIEQKVTVTGKVQTIAGISNSEKYPGFVSYSINTTDGQNYAFYPSSEINLISGTVVKVNGYTLDSQITANVDQGGLIQISVPPVDSIGDQKTLVILVKGSSSEPEPFTPAQAQNLVFNSPFQKFMQEQSYDQVSFSGDVVGWFTTGEASMNCYNGSSIFLTPAQLAKVASTYNINYSNYGRVVYLVNNAGGGCSGVGKWVTNINGVDYNLSQTHVGLDSFDQPSGWGNQPFSWTNLDYLLSHELGHALGVMHANGWDCGDVTLYGDCRHIEYGNYFDIMGGYSYSMDFNLLYKEILGWIPDLKIISIDKSGTYTINPLEQSAGLIGARININTTNGIITPYYLEFRKAIGFDSKLNNPDLIKNNGLFINAIVANYGFPFPRLLDAHPTPTEWWTDLQEQTTLNSGETFSDPNYGITIDSVNQTSSSTLSFNVKINPISCIFNTPSLSITEGNFDGISPNGRGMINARIMNYDSSSCATSTFNIRPILPLGWTVSDNGDIVLPPNGDSYYFIDFYPNNAIPGTYKIGIEVTNLQSGLKTTKQVIVNITQPLVITRVTPSFAPVNTTVVIEGTGFSNYNNYVSLSGILGWNNTQGVVSSKNGTEISHTIPSLVKRCDEGGCFSTSTQDGLYALSINTRGADASIDFEVISSSTTIKPTAIIIGTSTLSLSYDSLKKESNLTASFRLSVTAGSNNLNLYKDQNSMMFLNQTDGSKSYYGGATLYSIEGISTSTDKFGQISYILPAGKTFLFKVVSEVNPKVMFAGSYTAKFNSARVTYSGNPFNTFFVPLESNNLTNSKTIIGELSPYLTSATFVKNIIRGYDGIQVSGARLSSLQTASVSCNNGGVVLTKPYYSILFKNGVSAKFIITSGAKGSDFCSIQLKDPLEGMSNFTSFNLPLITVLSPNGGEVYKTGDIINIKWKAKNIYKTPAVSGLGLSIRDNSIPYNNILVTHVNGDVTNGLLPEDGYYSFKIPSTVKTGKYKVYMSITDTYAESGSYFDIIAPMPSVTIVASSTLINVSGEKSVISWSSKDTTSCEQSMVTSRTFGDSTWIGTNKPVSGSQNTKGYTTNGTYTYKIKCTGPGGFVEKTISVVVKIPVIIKPTVSITTKITPVQIGQSSSLSWISTSADSCKQSMLSGLDSTWSGINKPISGTQATKIYTSAGTYTYKIECLNIKGSSIATVNIVVTNPDVYCGDPKQTPFAGGCSKKSSILKEAGMTLATNETVDIIKITKYQYLKTKVAHKVTCPIGSSYRVCVEDYDDGVHNYVLVGVKFAK